MKQWLTSPGSSCIECSRIFPFSCSAFSKSSFCYEQAVGQRHQSQCQCIRVHHTFIPTRMPSIQNNTRISLFVTELYLRNWVPGQHVSASSRPTGVQLSHRESMIQLPSLLLNTSVLPCRAQEFDDFSLFVFIVYLLLVLWLHSIVYHSKSVYCTLSAVDIIFSLFTFLINTSRYKSTTSSTHLLREVSHSKRPHGT